VDPSTELLKMARMRAASAPVPVELLNGSAEIMTVESQAVDSVVMTWTLCSIPDPMKALAEVLRVLKPGGDLLFVEHGLSPDVKTKKWQDRINAPWKSLSGGCNLNREIDRLISSAGFHILRLDKNYLPGPRIFTFTYRGSARRLA
jgi:SAM-dependent methyltransferase